MGATFNEEKFRSIKSTAHSLKNLKSLRLFSLIDIIHFFTPTHFYFANLSLCVCFDKWC